eukprot:GEMP01023888.1.p1 GENE.GEMP01023888.1~~GEMP01023888.1.p1  ORF type:complete len:376 (+),score=97.33 GEMP01023888.1:53-1180(+)
MYPPHMNNPTPAYGMQSMGGGGMGGVMQTMQQGVPMQNSSPWAGQRFRGTVNSYSESNGYGFIGGDEVLQNIGKDVFVHQREITEVTGVARPQVPRGANVTFSVTVNPKGQPQARELRFEDQSFLQQIQQMGNAVVAGPGQQQNSFQNEYAQGGRRFKGFVRSFSQLNGFGFIGGDEIMQNFGKDVFLHFREIASMAGCLDSSQKPSVPSGTWCTFTVTLNQKGQPQARDVRFEEGQAGMMTAYQNSPAQGYGMQQAAMMPTNMAAAYQGMAAALTTTNAGWTNPSIAARGTTGDTGGSLTDADAYARVQADIAKFQQEVAALREANAKMDADKEAAAQATVKNEKRSRSRSRSRSGRRQAKGDEGDLDGRFTSL